MGLSTEQKKSQARELCLREYGFDPETLRKDAERYRWLRDTGSNTWVPFTEQWKMDAKHCDAAIDAEMNKS